MFCNQKYHCRKETPWKVNNHFIEDSGIDVDLTCVRETQAAMKAMVPNYQRKGPRRRPDNASLTDAAENSNDISQIITRSSGQIDGEGGGDTEGGIADLSNNQDPPSTASPSTALVNSDAGAHLRRSQRSRRPTRRTLAVGLATDDELQSLNDDVTTNTRQAKRSRTSQREIEGDTVERAPVDRGGSHMTNIDDERQ